MNIRRQDAVTPIHQIESDLSRHAGEGDPAEVAQMESETETEPQTPVRKPRRAEAEAELVRVHRLEQASLLFKAIDLAGATRLGLWPFSAPSSAPLGLAAWRKLCDEELIFAALDGTHVPVELVRLRVLDPADFGSLADLARRALELERRPRLAFQLGRALVLDGEPEAAREHLTGLLGQTSTPRQRARVHRTLACALEGMGEGHQALLEHERASALSGDLDSIVACLLLGLALGDRPRALFAVEMLERQKPRARGGARRLQRAVRRARLRYELVRGVRPAPAPELSSLALECVCDVTPAVADATYQLFA